MRTIWTLGTSNRDIQDFLEILKRYKIESVIDVRRWPTSRFEHFKKEVLKNILEKEKIDYHHLRSLGGYRGGYKKYTRSREFQKGLSKLEEIAKSLKSCIICSERLPWRCHRAYITQELEKKGYKIKHIIEKEKIWQPKKELHIIKPKCEVKKESKMPEEKEIGEVTHYFSKIGVAVVKLKDSLRQGETIHIKGHTSDFTQTVDSMEIEHKKVQLAKKGQSIGLKVKEHAREGDVVYRVSS